MYRSWGELKWEVTEDSSITMGPSLIPVTPSRVEIAQKLPLMGWNDQRGKENEADGKSTIFK